LAQPLAEKYGRQGGQGRNFSALSSPSPDLSYPISLPLRQSKIPAKLCKDAFKSISERTVPFSSLFFIHNQLSEQQFISLVSPQMGNLMLGFS